MNTENQLRQIADRIRYLREILEVSDEELASKINMPIDLYRSYESCEKDIPISMIYEPNRTAHRRRTQNEQLHSNQIGTRRFS